MVDQQPNELVQELRKIRFILKQILILLAVILIFLAFVYAMEGYRRWAESHYRASAATDRGRDVR